MTRLKIVTWNINSVRLRVANIESFVAAEQPDILCLQETKCQEAEFPSRAFREMGLPHLVIRGQRGGHAGVAIASRLPLDDIDVPDLCRENQARCVAARLPSGFEIHNIYLPAGGDIPDAQANEKFAHKLDFLERMGAGYGGLKRATPRLLLGDLNVAPHENDVWSHRQLLNVVSHTPEETERLEEGRQKAGFRDIARLAVPPEQKLYTWWSYRAADWAASNRGRRLDHIWASDSMMPQIDVASYRIYPAWRGGWKPSDHAPVSVTFTA